MQQFSNGICCVVTAVSVVQLLLCQVSVVEGKVRDLAASRREKQFRSVGKFNSGPLDFVALREAETGETKHFFRHGRHLLDAIAGGKSTFEVVEMENDDAGWNVNANSTYEDIANKAFHDTRTVYTLHSGDAAYVNLDSMPDQHAVAAVRDISDTHLVHCPPPGSSSEIPAPGSLVVGSAVGPWSAAAPPHVVRFLEASLRQLHPHHAANKREHGLLVARRVVAVRRLADSSGCLHLETENVHPFELFSNMRIESYIEQPQRFYSGNSATAARREDPTKTSTDPTKKRALFSENQYFNEGLGSPVTSCTNAEWGSPHGKYDDDITDWWGNKYHDSLHIGGGGRWAINAGAGIPNVMALLSIRNGGCVEYSDSLASFNYNYNPTSKSASQAITPPTGQQTTTVNNVKVTGQVSGISCTNCYAYLGAGITVIVEYGSSSAGSIGAEVQVGGAAGMDTEVTLNSPSASGEVVVSNYVAGHSNWDFAYVIGTTGLTLSGKFGGIDLDVKGSVTTTGGATFGTGSVAFTGAGGAAFSSNGGLALIGQSTFTTTPAYFNYLDPPLRVDTASMTMALVPKTLLELTFGKSGCSISFDSTVSVQVGIHYSYGTGTYSASAVVEHPVFATSATPLAASAASAAPAVHTFVPGDVITVNVSYSGFKSNETVIVYYAVTNTATGEEIPITRDVVFPDTTGAGAIQSTWTVPWSRLFIGELDGQPLPVTCSVRFSNHFKETYTTQLFNVSIFTETDGIFAVPVAGQVVPVDTPVAVAWDSLLLSYFKRKTFGGHSGDIVNTTRVIFEVTGERVDATGRQLQPPLVYRLPKSGLVFNNTGTATLVFPRNLTEKSNRFYLTVHDFDNFDVQGWSKGYFHLGTVNGEVLLPTASVSATVNAATTSAIPPAAEIVQNGRHRTEAVMVGPAPQTGEARVHLELSTQTCNGHLFTPGLGIGGAATSVGMSILSAYNPTFNLPANGGIHDTNMPGGACKAPVTFSPTSNPTRAPTFKPSFLPTQTPIAIGPSGGGPTFLPTAGPTAAQVTQIQQTQTLFGVDLNTASTPAFKAALATTVATSLNLAQSAVNVVSVVAARRRLLTGVAVTYTITATNTAAATLITMLSTAVTTGAFTTTLAANSGIATVAANTLPSFIDISPTSAPTAIPSTPPTYNTVDAGAVVGGVVGGVVLLLFCGVMMYRRRSQASARVAVDNVQPQGLPQAQPAAGGGAIQLVPMPQPAAPPLQMPQPAAPRGGAIQLAPMPQPAAPPLQQVAPPGGAGALNPLPPGWITQMDPSSGAPYYVYTPTGQTQWNHP